MHADVQKELSLRREIRSVGMRCATKMDVEGIHTAGRGLFCGVQNCGSSAGLDIILADITHVKYYLGFEL